MNPTTTPTSEFVLRRLGESFPQFMRDLWQSVPIPLLVLAVLAVAARVGYAKYYRKTHGPSKPDATTYWLGWGAIASVGALVLWVLIAFYRQEQSDRSKVGGSLLSALDKSNEVMWYAFVGGIFALGSFFVVLMYIKDSRSVRWFWATKLAILRIAVYAILCFVFLLPAKQTWERTEKRSRVVVLFDITPSLSRVSDEQAAKGKKPKTRMDYLIEFMTDKDVALVQNILKTNPVVIYPFGTRLDESPRTIEQDAAAWNQADWGAFAAYDFRPFMLQGLTPQGVEAIQNTTDPVKWEGPKPSAGVAKAEATNWADWATAWFARKSDPQLVNGMSPEDTKTLRTNLEKLERRIDVARSIALGTNVPDSITAAINRESPNMVQGLIVFSDMRSNLGSDSSYRELRDVAIKQKIPVFAVAVGEDRQSTSIVITEIQASDIVSPDEGFPVTVEADGWGLAGKTVYVELDIFLPGKDPKTADPDFTLKDSRKNKTEGSPTPYTLTFAPGEPPHGQVEFVIDPTKLATDPDPKAKALIVDSVGTAIQKPVLREGKWSVRARIAKDENEAFTDAEHVRDRAGIQVIQKPLRVLVVASAPSREFQFLRIFLDREVAEKRATVTLLVQNIAGLSGELTPNPNEKIIRRFPTVLDVSGKAPADPQDKLNNLNEYDVIVAFDPDWSEITKDQTENIQNWVERQGGGFIFVADRINTHQLARVEKPKAGVEPSPETQRLLPILELLPVDPEDPIAIPTKAPRPRDPRRLYLHPLPDSDLLKIDDSPTAKKEEKEPENDPIAGWERYFTDRDKYLENKDEKVEISPRRGFFSSYPVREVKAGAHVLAEFVNENFEHQKTLSPWLVLSKPDAPGRVCFMASGEIYRMFAFDKEYVERFWAKMMKYLAAKRNVKSSRGRVLVSKEIVSGTQIRVQAQILNTNSKPYPAGAIEPKFSILRTPLSGGDNKVEGPYPLSPSGVEGYFKGQVAADPKLFPTGDYEYTVVVEVPESTGDTLTGKFQLLRSDLEMDLTKPDFTAWLAIASDYDSAFQKRIPDKVKTIYGAQLPRDNGVPKLAFKLSDRELIKQIPECFRTDIQKFDNRGPVHDLWDKGVVEGLENTDSAALRKFGTNLATSLPGEWQKISWVLFVVVFLLGWEWLTRKLLRLA